MCLLDVSADVSADVSVLLCCCAAQCAASAAQHTSAGRCSMRGLSCSTYLFRSNSLLIVPVSACAGVLRHQGVKMGCAGL